MKTLFPLVVLTVLVSTAHSAQPEVVSIEVMIGSKKSVPADDETSPLKSPFGVDFDQSGNMFIAELYGGHLHEYSADGQVTTIGGDGTKSNSGDGGPLAKATFNGMHNLAITQAGVMYIADTFNHCVRAVDLKMRTIRTVIGTGKPGFSGDGGPAATAQFNNVMCVTLNPEQTVLHIADLNNRRIRAVDLATMQVTTIAGTGKKGVPEDGGLAKESPLFDPRAVAADGQGNVYVLERNGNALRMIDPQGKISTVAGTGKLGHQDGPALQALLSQPKHICVDDQHRVYIADDMSRSIRCYDPKTKTVSTLLGRGQGDPPLILKRPHGVCIENGTLYVVDTEHDRIIKVGLRN